MKKIGEMMTKVDIASLKKIIEMVEKNTDWLQEDHEPKPSRKKITNLVKAELAIKMLTLRKIRIQNYRMIFWMLIAIGGIIVGIWKYIIL